MYVCFFLFLFLLQNWWKLSGCVCFKPTLLSYSPSNFVPAKEVMCVLIFFFSLRGGQKDGFEGWCNKKATGIDCPWDQTTNSGLTFKRYWTNQRAAQKTHHRGVTFFQFFFFKKHVLFFVNIYLYFIYISRTSVSIKESLGILVEGRGCTYRVPPARLLRQPLLKKHHKHKTRHWRCGPSLVSCLTCPDRRTRTRFL